MFRKLLPKISIVIKGSYVPVCCVSGMVVICPVYCVILEVADLVGVSGTKDILCS